MAPLCQGWNAFGTGATTSSKVASTASPTAAAEMKKVAGLMKFAAAAAVAMMKMAAATMKMIVFVKRNEWKVSWANKKGAPVQFYSFRENISNFNHYNIQRK